MSLSKGRGRDALHDAGLFDGSTRPFAETKAQLAGYYIIDCESLDEAIEWAAKIPTECQRDRLNYGNCRQASLR
jgi:hypothetical protein